MQLPGIESADLNTASYWLGEPPVLVSDTVATTHQIWKVAGGAC